MHNNESKRLYSAGTCLTQYIGQSLPMPTAVAGHSLYLCLSVCLSVFPHDIIQNRYS